MISVSWSRQGKDNGERREVKATRGQGVTVAGVMAGHYRQ